MRVKSKYGQGVYIGLFAVLTFLAMFIFVALKVYAPENKINSEEVPSIVLLIPSLGIVWALYYTFKNAPDIIITHQGVSIKKIWGKKKKIEGQDILQIDLFEVVDSGSTWDSIITRIHLLSGEKIKIADHYYRNMGEMKSALVENFPDKIMPFQSKKKDNALSIELENRPMRFSGNLIFNFNNLLFFVILIVIPLTFMLPNKIKNPWLFALIPLALFYIIIGTQTHFFILNKNVFTIKNYLFPWIYKQYNIEDIIAFNFETPYRSSQGLRIITKDFRSRLYCAGSLREKHWQALQEKLESLGINFIS